MTKPNVDEAVYLLKDIPELNLRRGDCGIVRSTWFSPTMAYEVEFRPAGLDCHTRALLLAEQIEVRQIHIGMGK